MHMQKLSTIIATICLFVFIAGVTKMVQFSDQLTYFSGFIAFLILTVQVVSGRLKEEEKKG